MKDIDKKQENNTKTTDIKRTAKHTATFYYWWFNYETLRAPQSGPINRSNKPPRTPSVGRRLMGRARWVSEGSIWLPVSQSPPRATPITPSQRPALTSLHLPIMPSLSPCLPTITSQHSSQPSPPHVTIPHLLSTPITHSPAITTPQPSSPQPLLPPTATPHLPPTTLIPAVTNQCYHHLTSPLSHLHLFSLLSPPLTFQ